jgi:hypothetical protein
LVETRGRAPVLEPPIGRTPLLRQLAPARSRQQLEEQRTSDNTFGARTRTLTAPPAGGRRHQPLSLPAAAHSALAA